MVSRCPTYLGLFLVMDMAKVVVLFFDDVFHQDPSTTDTTTKVVKKDIIDSRCPINAKDSDPIHNGQFGKDMNRPQETIPQTDGPVIIGKVTGGITQQGGDNRQDSFGTRRMGPTLQLFPQGHGGHFSLIVHLTTLEPMKVENRQDTMDCIRDRPTPIEWDL